VGETTRTNEIPIPPFGRRLRAIREARGYKQKVIADRAGVSVSHLNRLELGQRDAKVSTVCHIAHALGVDPALVFAWEEGQELSA